MIFKHAVKAISSLGPWHVVWTQHEMKMFLQTGIEHNKNSILSKECIIFS